MRAAELLSVSDSYSSSLRTSSAAQLPHTPLQALADGRIQVGGLLKSFQALNRVCIPQLDQQIDKRNLHQGRLLTRQGVYESAAHLLLIAEVPQRVERGEADIDTGVITKRVQQSAEDLRIRLPHARAPVNALQALTGRLLLQQ